MSPRRLVLLAAAIALAATCGAPHDTRADGPSPASPVAKSPPPPPPAREPLQTVVHVPLDELDVLLKAQGRAVVLGYPEYRALLEAARARDAAPGETPPEDVVRLSGEGVLDLTDEKAARLHVEYRIQGLAPGPRSVGFDSGGIAIERIDVEGEGGAGGARYEARDGHGRIYLDGPGVRRVTVEGSAVPLVEGARRRLDLWLPNPAAMALSVTLPAGVDATLEGEGAPLVVHSPAGEPAVVVTRPSRGGHLVLGWNAASRDTAGPAVLDADVRSLVSLGDGVVAVRALVRADVLRTPTDALALEVPPDLAVRGVTGTGVVSFTRSDDRTRLDVRLEKPVIGRVEALVEGERPLRTGPGVELPAVRVIGALRHAGEIALRLGADVNARAVHVDGGRRVAGGAAGPEGAGVLRYALFRPQASVRLDIEPGALRVDSTSTYYLNLAEPAQTLLATVTYRVVEGTLHRLSPRFPREFELRELTIQGVETGFTRDVTADGHVEIALAQGVPVGGEVRLLATLERARTDWVPESGHVAVPFDVPASGAAREDAYAAVGADAGFEVLDAGGQDVVAVGAADLTARGLSSVGLVYGYRVDGPAPRVALDVVRRVPLVEALVVTMLEPGARRVDLRARAIHRIQRAGVRRFFVDVPSSAGDRVRFDAPALRAATRLSAERRPADVPAGYDRWQVELERRVIGRFVVTASWFLDRDRDDWTLASTEPVAARVPVERAERQLVVGRAAGLEVGLPGLAATADVRTLDVTELDPDAGLDPASVFEVLRLPATRDGVDVAVKRHGGAAVLGAIATEVAIRTAVAREGILRSRADVTLFNIDRQFVEVELPPDSTLVGAVVDGRPVKPLVGEQGTLLLTVAPTLPSARVPNPRSSVTLTYETRLAGPVGADVRVAGPRFPGLEVLHTSHEVGVEPDLVIERVEGDLATEPLARPALSPWIVSLAAALPRACTRTLSVELDKSVALEGRESAVSSRPAGGGSAGKPGATAAPAGKPATPSSRSPSSGAVPELTPAPGPSAPPPTPVVPTTPTTTDAPPQAPADLGAVPPSMPPPVPPSAREPSDEPSDRESARDPDGAGGRPGLDGPSSSRQGAGRGKAGERDGDGLAAKRARRGQLSLDVPVFLAPNRVLASRIGGGGTLELHLGTDAGRDRAHDLLGLLALSLGLLVVGAGWLSGPWTVAAGVAFALVIRLSFGVSASTFVVACIDAFTLLGVLLLARRLLLGRASRVAAVLLLAVAAAGVARADDAPAPAPAPAPDPAPAPTPTIVVSDDRVFVPLAAWLELERRAHPERDPELVELGRVVTWVEASYRTVVAERDVRGTARFVFAQRGAGVLLVPVPFAGVAITDAKLDGVPVRLLLDEGGYRVPLDHEGDHVLQVAFTTPLTIHPQARVFTFSAPTFAGAVLDVAAGAFDGDLRVSGAGRVAVLPSETDEFAARAFLGRPTGSGAVQTVTVTLAEKSPAAFRTVVKSRVESRTVHSLRDAGTESVVALDVHVLQGEATFVDVALPDGVDVLEAAGPRIQRWETSPGRLRLVLVAPTAGTVAARVRVVRAATSPERTETLPELAVRDTTGESGLVIVNADPSMRLEADAGAGLFRTGRPTEPDATGPDGLGRVLGAWRFAARPAAISVRAERARPRVEVDTRVRATFGDDRLRTRIEAKIRVERAPVGELVFALPGTDELRAVTGPGIESFWLDGTGEARRLVVRMLDLVEGERAVGVELEQRLAGRRADVAVPRASLLDAQADRGRLVLFAAPDVEPAPATVAGLRSLPPVALEGEQADATGARATHGYEWDAPVTAPLLVALKAPEREVEAVVVSQVSPSDEETRLEHLVLFDVRRGTADRVAVFVPDGGLAAGDVVRARDLRELRSEPAARKDADGKDVKGRVYTLILQSAKSGLVEVTISQVWPVGAAVHVVQPEAVKATRWFGLVRTFLDGEVEAKVVAGTPDPAAWAELPFLPTGLVRASVLRSYAARAPYLLDVVARRHRLEVQAGAVVLAARAEVVVGLDGEARVRMRYRVFNRSNQFLALELPEGAVLYGALAAGRPVKPLAGPDGTILIPVPKVPLGGTGYEVSITYRARVGRSMIGGGDAALALPTVHGVTVDRTTITLRVPSGYEYAFDSKMSVANAGETQGDDVEALLVEATEVVKVAETGTLDQRRYALGNAAPLLDEAGARLDAWVRTQGRADRAPALRARLDALAAKRREAEAQCSADSGVFYAEAQFAANSTALSNANGQTLVELDDGEGVEAKPRSEIGAPASPGAATTANWKFNKEVPFEGPAVNDLIVLKKRLQGELQRRGDDERRKSVDVDKEEKSRADAGKSKAPDAARPRGAAVADDATARFDENRNHALLNERLGRIQSDYHQFRGPAGGAAQSTLPATPEETEQIHQADVVARERTVDRGEDGVDAAARTGLMGVDVPLPADGRTYWFVGARAGSAVRWSASPVGTAWWKRALLFLGLSGAFTAGLVHLLRRTRAARPVVATK